MTRVLVGRTSELKELHDFVDRVRSGCSAALVIRGEPGVGKTVLLNENPVEYHLKKVFLKLGVKSRAQLAEAIPQSVGEAL